MRRRFAVAIGALMLLATSSALAAGVAPRDATKEQKRKANNQFFVGSQAFWGTRYEAARARFQASYDIVASPNSHLMLARALAKLGRSVEAYQHFRKTADEADEAAKSDRKYAATRDAALAELDELKSAVGLLEIRVVSARPESKLRVGDREIDVAETRHAVAVSPGHVRVEMVGAIGPSATRDVDVQAGQSVPVELSAAPPSTPGASMASATSEQSSVKSSSKGGFDKRTAAYVAGGVGVVGVLTFVVFGAMNNAKFHDVENQCTNNVCPASLEAEANTGQTYQTIANIGLGIGIVGLAAGGALYYLDTRERRPGAAGPPTTTYVAVSPGFVTVKGSF